jgi:glycosyltransferase involved in cell wall biosynthesis/energy-coupling factor transporter ATP-binding protein EcfA2
MSATQKNPRGSSKEGATLEVVFLATAWGPTYGGINAFNTDFARALSQILSGRVACVVLSASDADIRSASAAGVTLLQVGQSRSHSDFDASRAHDVLMALRNAGVHPAAGTWWVGHDAHTGELANEMPKASEAGKSVVIHHMSYEDYKPFMHGDAEDARRKADYQEEILRAADRAFAVGPLLLASLKEKLEPSGKYDSARMIVPGLAEIQPRHESFDVFQAITFGRLQRETDRIKQVRLAIAAFADACSVRKYPDAVPAPLQGQPRLYVYGIGRAEESQLREYAARLADRVLPFMPLPYADRESIFRKLRQTDVAMMLSWHEGFGLVGWEAISAEVPLIVTKNSGLYQLVDRELGDGGTALLLGVDIEGAEDPSGEQNFSPADLENTRKAIWKCARNRDRAKQNARTLLRMLQEKDHTWDSAARKFATDMGLRVSTRRTVKPPSKPLWDVKSQGSPFPGLRPMTEKDVDIFYGREPQAETLANKLEKSSFVIVVGASGSGKSSLVWAGLLPMLQRETSPEGVNRVCVRMTPGEAANHDPVRALAEALAELLSRRATYVENKLRSQQGLEELITQMNTVHGARAELILFVDQFEELFTLVPDSGTGLRKAFINLLDSLMRTERIRVVATMRAAFQGHCMDSADFGETLSAWFTDGFIALSHPGERALYDMIQGPSKAAGIEFEAGLIDRIVRDTGSEPGSLALMAFALNELYGVSGSDGMLSASSYDRIGGVAGAVARAAEAAFEKLTSSLKDDAERAFEEVFRHLVEVDEISGVATRRRAPLADMSDSALASTFVTSFVEARLLVTSEEGSSVGRRTHGRTIVEVGHEALFGSWPRLRDWIETRKDHLRLRSQLQREAVYWDLRGKTPAYRWSDERALEAARMMAELSYEPSDLETLFLGPVHQRTMLEKLREAQTAHDERATIGVRLALLGDTRPGVGVKNDLPHILWCPVTAGQVRLDGAGVLGVDPFFIAKYPVTYAQYRLFLDAADGYRALEWWRDMSKRYYQEPGRQIPLLDNHPAVNVDWIEAVAYCRWLSRRLQSEVRLPTEWEWQQAATNGNTDFEFPWGKDWESSRANTYENGLNRTVAVGLYAQGTGEDQPLDLVGNVWEWCINDYSRPVPLAETTFGGLETRAIRGGAGSSRWEYARASYRNHYRPSYRFDALGFRLVCAIPNSGEKLESRSAEKSVADLRADS